ncbi:MAG: hypothetical protein JXA18_10755 [Chitinispirillaceae bacterium]|nr:hypothetical protein [Chitinispirillaceae bacterium]
MSALHRELAAGRWYALSFCEQMANVGSEVERTLQWNGKGNGEYAQRAFERALELLDLTIVDVKNRRRLREIVRTREALVDFFAFGNEYRSNEAIWRNYFQAFAYAARLRSGK